MFEFFIRNPVIVTVGSLLIVLFGILAYLRVPVQMIPDLDARVITVITRWPGATPQDVEREIIIEQEDYLRSIPGIERIISRASLGRSEIELEFPHGTDVNEVLIRVNNALSQVPGYPENVDEPRLVTNSFSLNPFMYLQVLVLPGNPQDLDIRAIQDYVEDIAASRLDRVPGVADADIQGGAERQIRIYIDPARLAERGISISELRRAIRGRNRDLSGGDLDSGKRRYLIRTIGRFESTKEIENLVIARRGTSLIRLRDVGYAELGKSELRFVSRSAGQATLTIRIRRQTGTNVVQTRDAVVDAIEELNQGVLGEAGLQIFVVGDDAKYVEQAAGNVRKNLAIGAILATLVLFWFLRSGSATLIGAMGIPICTVTAFLGLLLTERTINVISLAGVAFAIGMTLDNSIVVLESIYRHRSAGKDRLTAALEGVSDVWRAVLASTLTTVFVFIPVLFVQEEAGQLYSDIAVAISSSIMMSMLVAIALVPTACRYLLDAKAVDMASGSAAMSASGWSARALNLVRWINAEYGRRILCVVTVLAMTLAIIVWLTPKAEYLPEGEEYKVFAQQFSPPGYSLTEAEKSMDQVGDYLVPHIGEDPALFDRGERAIPGLLFLNQIGNSTMIMHITEVLDRSHVDELIEILSAKLSDVPGMSSFVTRGSIFASNFGGSRSINVDITGGQLTDLYGAAFSVFGMARQVFENPQVRAYPSSLTMGQPVLEVHPDWERSAEFGISAEDLGYIVWVFSDGAFVDEFFLGDDKIDMFLYSTEGTIQNPEDLENLLVYSPDGGILPLSSLAMVKETISTDLIRRLDGNRTITVSIIPPKEIALEEGVEIVQREIIRALYDSGAVASRVSMRVTGASDRLTATREALTDNFIIAIVICYLLLVAILGHWGFPLVIMINVPIGISGGLVGLWLLNAIGGQLGLVGLTPIQQPMDMITMLGFLILIGTVVNNPILIVEKTMHSIRAGVADAEAILDATRSRLRPVMMSTITTVVGLSPLVFLPGPGTELYRGLGAVVLFGLLSSALTTLLFLPALLGLVLRLRDVLNTAGLGFPRRQP